MKFNRLSHNYVCYIVDVNSRVPIQAQIPIVKFLTPLRVPVDAKNNVRVVDRSNIAVYTVANLKIIALAFALKVEGASNMASPIKVYFSVYVFHPHRCCT